MTLRWEMATTLLKAEQKNSRSSYRRLISLHTPSGQVAAIAPLHACVRLEDPYLPLQRQGKGYPTLSISQTAIPSKQTFSQSSLLPIPLISLVLIVLIHKAGKQS